MWRKLKEWARFMKKSLYTLYFATKDTRVSLPVKVFTIAVVAYAFSPIDLIPDFIPILGYVDDVLIVPVGIYFALKMLPQIVIQDSTKLAEEHLLSDKPKNWFAAGIILMIWFAVLVWGTFVFIYK
ncbi:YkvA family protein [Paenisporosarcina sp. FSL H8-0542]|uniref:YkvA family protein n=1 Tax=Paenisporosarcina sp. FSL H8-0542 TaxID=2921401 RepID=UPI00315A2FEF